MNRNILLATTAAAGIIGLTALAPAQAQITQFNINGGGSSLATSEYIRTIDAIAGTTNIWVNETTHAGQIGQVRYIGDGSGAGQKAFLIQDATVHGYTAGQAVHFGGSDAFLSANQISCWQGVTAGCTAEGLTTGLATVAGGGQAVGGPIIQLPAFGTPLAIAHTILYSKAVTLDDNDLCGIFSGKLTNWSQTENTPGSVHPAALNGTIGVVYRIDGSGSSFLLTQHLSRVCTTSNTASGITFTTTKYFADIFGSAVVSGSNKTVNPSATVANVGNFFGASGSTGVANLLITKTNTVAYLTPDYTSIAPKSVPNSSGTANAWTPNASSPYLNLKTAKVYNSHQAKAYAPNPGGASVALKNPNLVNHDTNPSAPSTLAQATDPSYWIPQVGDPLLGYPIVGYTALIFSQCYADLKYTTVAGGVTTTTAYNPGTEIKAFLTQLYGSGNKTNLTLEGFTAAPTGFQSTIIKSFTKNVNGFNTDINNTAICQAAGASGVGTFAGL